MESPVKTESHGVLPMRRVLSFATITAAGFILGKFGGIAKEMVVSAHFGVGSGLDAYVLASLVPTTINNIIAGSAITAAVMPTFARYLAAGKRSEFWYAASVITNIVLLITGALTVLGMLLASPLVSLVAGASPAATQAQAVTMLVIMMPTLFLGALLNMLMAMLNSVDRFTGPALIFIALNVGMIITVVVLTPVIGVNAVAWGFLIGVALQVLVQWVELRKEHPEFTWRLDFRHPALREVLIAFIPVTALAITAQINLVVDRTMAASLPEGSVTALYYADVINGAFYMIGYSLGIAIFPNLSRLAALNDIRNSAQSMKTSLRILIYILAPITLLLFAFAVPTIGLILGRGKFDALAIQMTAQALAMYAIGLVAIAAVQIIQRAFYAFSDSVTPFGVGVVTAILHFGLNLILMQHWQQAGIALSTSLTAVVSIVALLILFQRRVPGIALVALLVFTARCMLLAFVSTAPFVWLYANGRWETGTVSYAVGVAFACAGGLVYLILTIVTRTPESLMLLGALRKFLKKKGELTAAV